MRDWTKPIKCEVPGYTGSVKFPWPFLLHHYKEWQTARIDMRESVRSGDADPVRVIYIPNEEKSDDESKDIDSDFKHYEASDWQIVCRIVDLRKLKVDPKSNISVDVLIAAKKDESGESTPYGLATWLIPLLAEYVEGQLDPFG